jgi:hypothetical protein
MRHQIITYALLVVSLAVGARAMALLGGFPWNHHEPLVVGPGRIMGAVAILLGVVAIAYGVGSS